MDEPKEDMELNEFVQKTIEQIIDGVYNSQPFAKEKGAIVNPPTTGINENGCNQPKTQNIEFDVGLTSTSIDESVEGIGVFLGSVGLGKKNESVTGNTAITKVKFTVPIVLPKHNSNGKR